jgi:phospholysine phosphohistidine inorganic pyrophosphate phosphatase
MAARATALLIDLDGVIYEGDRAVVGASAAVEWIEQRGIPHLFLTNTTSRPRTALVDKLAHLGIATNVTRIHTPPVAAVRWLSDHAPGPAALFVPPATAAEFDELPQLATDAETGAASVVIGDLGEAWDFGRLNRAFRLLMCEPHPVLVALGMTRYFRAPEGLRLDVAPFVTALEYATGISPVVLGKPAAPFFDAALAALDCRAADAVMIGDDIVGDVQGAQHAGVSGVLVRTGKFQPSDLEGAIAPDGVLASIAELPAWWQAAANKS